MIESFFDSLGIFCINLLFFDLLSPFHVSFKMPFFTTFILGVSIYFMFALRFLNFTKFIPSVKYIVGTKTIAEDKTLKNAIPSRSAFLTAITGCIGVGSISGVAAAVYIGGPGVALWIPICAILTMPLRYCEVFLGHYCRNVKKGEIIEHGPYAYLRRAGEVLGSPKKLPKIFVNSFAVLFLISAIGACWMQSNPMIQIFSHTVFGEDHANKYQWIVGLIFSLMTFGVVIGGLKRVVEYTSKLGIVMAAVYIFAIVAILYVNSANIWPAIKIIVDSAFTWNSVYGGAIATMMISLQRGTVASEVGLGTTPLLHGLSSSKSSVQEGILAMFGPFIGLMLFFFVHALALVASGAYMHNAGDIIMIQHAFITVSPWFNYILVAMVFLFGFTTITAWYYYAENSLKRFTEKKIYILGLQIFYPSLIFISGFATFTTLLRLIDFSTLIMAIPNVLAILILSKVIISEYKKSKNI